MNFALVRANVRTDATPSEHALARFCLGSGTVVHIEITDRMEAAESAWRQLSAPDNFTTSYQNYDFCAFWFRHVGEGAGMRPLIVIGRDHTGGALFLWPLVRRKIGPCQVASYFCGRHANFGSMLWRADIVASVTAQDLRAILAHLPGEGVDALMLLDQPESWHGVANPMRLLPNQSSSDWTYGVTLTGSGEEIIASQLNSDTRRKFRRKERHLAQLPGFRHVHASSAEDVDRYITEFMRQKAVRLSARGIKNAFDEPGIEGFLRAACKHGLADGRPLIEIHALDSDGDVLALFAGIHDSQCFSTMFNSYTLSKHARWSPGFILLLKLVEDCAARGFATLNLGVGSADYKASLCDIKALQFDSFLGLTMRGRLWALAMRTVYRLKGAIKRNPAILNFVNSLRAKLLARSPVR